MSAPNFAITNASRYFVVEANESWEYEDILACIQDAFRTQKWENEICFSNENKSDDNRSYPGIIFGYLSASKYYERVGEANVIIELVLRSGYYEAANLDYEIRYEVEGIEYDNPQDVNVLHVANLPPKQAKLYNRWIANWMEDTTGKMTSKIEAIYSRFSEQYIRTALFSNGEAIYSKIKNK